MKSISAWARMRASLLAVIAAAVLFFPAGASATQNVYQTFAGGCVTTSAGSANVTVNVNNPNWQAGQFIYTFNPGNYVFTGASGIDPNIGGSQAFFTLPPGTYTVDITDASTGVAHGSASGVVVSDCTPQPGSLTVRKFVTNTTGRPTPNATFNIGIACTPNGPSYGVLLSNANMYMSTRNGIAAGSQCTATEYPSPAPAGCHWQVSYRGPQTVPIVASRTSMIAIGNTLICPCPVGSSEQTIPGSTVKFCCDHAIDPNSTSFCCTREGMGNGNHDQKQEQAPEEKP